MAGRVVHTPWDYAYGGININPTMNFSLKNNLGEIKGEANSRSGVIMMDFYSKHGYDDTLRLVPRIIGLNFD